MKEDACPSISCSASRVILADEARGQVSSIERVEDSYVARDIGASFLYAPLFTDDDEL